MPAKDRSVANPPCANPPCALPRAAAPEKLGDSLFARQIRAAFGLLQSAVEEAAEAAERQNVQMAAELEDLQSRALRSIQDSALATIELFEALGAARSPGELADRQMELARRQRDAAQERLNAFVDSARGMVSVLADPLTRRIAATRPARERGPAEEDDSVLARIDKLTNRQKKVLALLAEGLPNKVIAHELGISETTVKAHVGEILRKLKVYNRARAIVMLAPYDMNRIAAQANGAAH